jgi:signal transduction histidine kinase
MKLSSFIETHQEEILEAWESDAFRPVPRPSAVSFAPLRDHLGELLRAIARDLEAGGPGGEAREGTQERATWTNVKAVAEKHGAQRQNQGIPLKHMVPEFPALRRSVTRLWLRSLTSVTPRDLDDLIRFDEALDLSLTLSIAEFMDRLNRSRENFLGILGHDLRDPLSTIVTAAKLMLEDGFDQSTVPDVAGRIVRTGERMHHLIVDLLDFTRARVGGQMPIERRETDLARAVRNVADEFASSHPDRPVHIQMSGDMSGRWDEQRMSQAIGNLLANAVHHGAQDKPIDVSASADEREVAIAVHNEGPPIPKQRRSSLFEPWNATEPQGAEGRETNHLGLGLYIANAIVSGHEGRIDVDSSSERGTTFTIHLPRQEG